MLLSQAFLPISKNKIPNTTISHQLMLQTGMLYQLASGIYSWLPFGYAVLQKISNIIREEMNNIGFQEMIIPTVQPIQYWEATGRYNPDNKEMLHITDRHDAEFIYGPTSEDCIADIFKNSNVRHTQMPQMLYNIQWKFRDEKRPRNGIMRSREFLMKDGYTFDLTEEDAVKTYQLVFDAYVRIFARVELRVIPALADNGTMGGKISHDFHIFNEAGEDTLTFDKAWLDIEKPTWSDVEKYFSTSKELNIDDKQKIINDYMQRKSIEVGHIFLLGTRYTDTLNIYIQGSNQEKIVPYMGCYGIGVSRLIGAIIEQHSDEKGIIWPKEISPYKYMLINLGTDIEDCSMYCNEIYKLDHENILYDDRKKVSAGDKFNTADLLGVPMQIIIGKNECNNQMAIIKDRRTGIKTEITKTQLIEMIQNQAEI